MIQSSAFFYEPSPLPQVDESQLEKIYESDGGHCILLKGHRNDRVVVYKALKEAYRDDPVYQRMLRREYEIGVSLKHPGVCEVMGWHTLPGYGDCIEMEWVDGCELGEWLKMHVGDKQLVFGVMLDICDAVSYIHRKQVIHKDIKPENILITRVGSHVKIIDFGLSDAGSILTGKDPAGTVNYAAPEVLAGGVADERSDIFSFGRILLQAGPAFSGVARKCSAEDPQKRFKTFEEVRKALVDKSTATVLRWVVLIALVVVVAGLWMYLNHKGSSSRLFLDAVEQVRQSSIPS